MSDIFDIKDMTEEDIKLQYITPALITKWDIKKITCNLANRENWQKFANFPIFFV